MQILGRDVIITIIISVIFMFIVTRKTQQNRVWHMMGALVLVLAMTVVFSLTGVSPISGFHTDVRLDEIAYIPVIGTLEMIRDVAQIASVEKVPINEVVFYLSTNILGNILMFGPLGFILPLLWKRFRSFSRTILFGFCISLLIECWQLFLARGTDIDDLILNTLGSMLGYLAFMIFRKIFPRVTEKFTLDDDTEKLIYCVLPYIYVIIPCLVIVILGFYDRAVYFKI